MLRFIDKLYSKKISSKGLGVFRICFSLVLLLEVNRIYRYKELYYDPIPFIKTIDFNYSLVLTIWQICLLAICFGFLTRLFAFGNYIIAFYLINDLGVFEYHMDYVYLGVSFLLIIIPTEKSYSIDASFQPKIKPNAISNKTSVLSYYSIIFVGIALVYFGSIFFKLKSNAWLSGLGIWLPCSLPQVAISNNQWILNQEYLIKIIGYTALAFEFIFAFTFFFKKWRIPLCLVGILMHVGIALLFPIPYFAFGYVAMYLLLIPVSVWEQLDSKLKLNHFFKLINVNFLNHIYYYYFKCIYLDFRYKWKINLVKAAFIIICFLQFNAAINISSKKVTYLISENINNSDGFINLLTRTVKKIRHYSQEVLGITGHGVFVDGHYIGFDKILTLKYNGTYLPLFDNQGMPGEYLKSGIWANYNFRVNQPFVFTKKSGKLNLEKGLIRYAAFWANKNDIKLDQIEFDILIKSVKANFEWEENLLENNLKQPWTKVGKIIWTNKVAQVTLEENINE